MESICIFHNDKFIRLRSCEENLHELKNNEVYSNSFVYKDTDELKSIINDFLRKKELANIEIRHTDFDELFMFFKLQFHIIEAAGGIVRNTNDELLLIKRFGEIDLPKGKIEKGETPDDTALREVYEECGIDDLTVVETLQPTYHIYSIKDKQILKKTHWYRMIYGGSESLKPQTEEGITDVMWAKKDELYSLKKITYPSLAHFFH